MASVLSNRITKADEPVTDEAVEAVVIGSGFGGAVAALRLGQAGIHTVLLERGRRWPITSAQNTFATYENPDGRAAWLSPTTFTGIPVDIYTGILERKNENGIYVLCGAGVGGGSLVYNAFTYQPSRELFYNVFPSSINYDELDQVYYPRVRAILGASPLPEDILATKYYESTRLFLKQATTAGLPNRLLDVNVDWDIVRQEIAGTKVASAIIGQSWFGNNSGAKNSLDRNYLARAEKTGFVEILPLHVATVITEVPGQGYRILYNQINESGEIIASKSITCRYLFLAAGSMETSALLVVNLNWLADAPGNRRLVKSVEFTFKLLDRKNTTFASKNRPKTRLEGGITGHPLGGAVLGKACDLYGWVIGYQGLYVVDGTLIPGSTGCTNPSLTIAAIAERCLERILAEDIS